MTHRIGKSGLTIFRFVYKIKRDMFKQSFP